MQLRLLTWSLRHRRRRHFLNATIMAVTVAVVVLFVSVVVKMSTFKSKGSRGRVLVNSVMMQAGNNNMPQAFAQMFAQIDGVKDVQCQKFLFAKINNVGYFISGEQPSGVQMNQDLLPVEPAVYDAWMATKPMGAILTETVSKELNLPVGKEAELPTPMGNLKIKVVGLSRGGLQARRMAVHLEYLREFMGNDGTCSFRVFADPAKSSKVADEIVERTRNTSTPAQTIVDAEYAAGLIKSVSRIPTLLGFLGLFLALTTTLTLANGSAIAIRERRVEMASLRVMGFLPRTVAVALLGEAVLVGLIGGVIGVAAVYLAIGDGFSLTGPAADVIGAVQLSPIGVVAGLLTSVLVPIAGALPATIASIRQPLVSALRDNA